MGTPTDFSHLQQDDHEPILSIRCSAPPSHLLEQKAFNTGQLGARTLPTTSKEEEEENMTPTTNQYSTPEKIIIDPQGEDSLSCDNGPLSFIRSIKSINDNSNLSRCSVDTSDTTPEKKNKFTPDKKSMRKKRKGEETPRTDKKITDFIRSSPKRLRIGIPSTSIPSIISSSEDSTPSNTRDGFDQLPIGIDREVQTDTIEKKANSDELMKYKRAYEEAMKKNNELEMKIIDKDRRNEESKETIRRLLIEQNESERKALRKRTSNDKRRLGKLKLRRHGETFERVFVDGYAVDDIGKKLQAITKKKNELANAVVVLKKRKPITKEKNTSRSLTAQLNAMVVNGMNTPSIPSSIDDGFILPEIPLTLQEYSEREEVLRLLNLQVKKEEADIQIEKENLERERTFHIREMKRAESEESSRYKNHEILNKRYLPLSLLGKGGNGEVWKSYDLDENRYVAIKIHHVNKEWSETYRVNYVKHAFREKKIHQTLNHERIVQFLDVFTIDNNSFATVMECCTDIDLDFYLKQKRQISEKEARNVIMQITSALMYLSERKIIHYDLKPANILLEHGTTNGAIKVTDFGLSKEMENSDDVDSMELTSQGAGTLWYLPPETFVVGTPKISPKVDVWSLGVILYQCIYGKKPFGDGQTQQKIMQEKIIMKATEVHFPIKPSISPACQSFIRRCLQYHKDDRADIFELAEHEFLKFGSRSEKKFSTPASPSTRLMNTMDES